MAVNRQRPHKGYGLQNALQNIPPLPIVAQRSPTVFDKAEIGTPWINSAEFQAYILAAYQNGEAQWLNTSGGSGTFDSVTVDPGDLTVVQGDVILDAGDVIVTAGDITVTAGTVTSNAGEFDTLTVNNGMLVTGPAIFPALADGVVQADNTGLLFSDNGTDGQVIIGNTAGAPTWASITSPNATITITGGPNTLELDTAAAAGIASVVTDAGTALPIANAISIVGDGVNVDTSAATNVVTINLANDLVLPGSLTATTSITATTGDITASAGNIMVTAGDVTVTAGNVILPATNAGATEGVISIGSLQMHSLGINNLFIGNSAGNFTFNTATCTDNIALGTNALSSMDEDVTDNIAIGTNALAALDNHTGSGENIAIGVGASQNVTGGNARFSIAIGTNALNSATSIANYNTAIGYQAGMNLDGGGGNILIGTEAGSAYTGAEASNILIGHNLAGTTGESNVIRIGSTQTTCFIEGIFGVTTASATTAAVLVSDDNQLGTIASSIRFKENIEDMDEYSNDILSLRPVHFEYKQRPGIKTWGLIAEEVYKVIPNLVNLDKEGIPFSVKYHELPVLILNEMQRLQERIDELESSCTCRK